MKSILLTSLLTLAILVLLGLTYVSVYVSFDRPVAQELPSPGVLGRISFVAAIPAKLVFIYADGVLSADYPLTYAIPFLFAWLFWTATLLFVLKVYQSIVGWQGR